MSRLCYLYTGIAAIPTLTKLSRNGLSSWKFKVHHIHQKTMQTLDSLLLVCGMCMASSYGAVTYLTV